MLLCWTSFMLCQVCSVSQTSPLFRMSLCWMSLHHLVSYARKMFFWVVPSLCICPSKGPPCQPRWWSDPGVVVMKTCLSLSLRLLGNRARPGNTKGGSITVLLTSCLTGLKLFVWQLTIFVIICKTDWSKPVKQEVNGTVIFPPHSIPWGNTNWREGLVQLCSNLS